MYTAIFSYEHMYAPIEEAFVKRTKVYNLRNLIIFMLLFRSAALSLTGDATQYSRIK